VNAQLSGTVGPTTTTAHKAATKVCNILSYGGVASKTTDNGPAIASAWADCKAGGESMSSYPQNTSFQQKMSADVG
jgi:rhamnogalacturonan hydrolase